MRPTVSDAYVPAMNIADLWRSTAPDAWERALQRYWDFVQPRNLELEKSLNALDVSRLRSLSSRGWYDFLHDEYFRWKYTAPNRYATTTTQLGRYLSGGELDELEHLRQQLVNLDRSDVRRGLTTAKKIRGLGTAGASGLLSLMFPECFATVDQFVVKALRLVTGPSRGKRSRQDEAREFERVRWSIAYRHPRAEGAGEQPIVWYILLDSAEDRYGALDLWPIGVSRPLRPGAYAGRKPQVFQRLLGGMFPNAYSRSGPTVAIEQPERRAIYQVRHWTRQVRRSDPWPEPTLSICLAAGGNAPVTCHWRQNISFFQDGKTAKRSR